MQFDPDQREWLYKEEQERLHWKRRLEQRPQSYSKWVPATAAGVVLLLLVAFIVSSDAFAELMTRIGL
jgi:hypothetical protein